MASDASPPLVIAHRGDSKREQENSLAAVKAAVAAGADMVEVDVRRTEDGIFVCAHDPDLSRLAGDAQVIADLTLEKVQTIARRARVDVPRLADVLGAARFRTAAGGGIGVLLDLKPELAPADVKRIAEIVWASEMASNAVFGLRDPVLLSDVRSVLPEARTLAFYKNDADFDAFVAGGVDAIRIWDGDQAAMARAQSVGMPIWVTAGGPGTEQPVGAITAERVRALAASGISGLIVDDPLAVSQWLRDIVNGA